jgi:hypothetical protein
VAFSRNIRNQKIWHVKDLFKSIVRDPKWTNAKGKNVLRHMAHHPLMI